MFRTLAIAAAITLPSALLAQDIPAQSNAAQSTPAQSLAAETARDAQEIAQLMGDVQDAVGLAQAQYAGMAAGAPGPGYQGAIALPGEAPGTWRAIIVGRLGDAPDAPLLALAEYEIAQGRILTEVIHPPESIPPLEGPASAMAQARNFAPRAVLAAGTNAFCVDEGADTQAAASVTFATIVLPPRDDGTFDAYVLNGPVEDGAIPLGRHYRVGFDAFGLQGVPELVTDTCEVITWSSDDPDLASRIYVTEFVDATAPSPVHVFLSTLLPMRMAVVTGDMVWPVTDGTVADPVPVSQAGIQP